MWNLVVNSLQSKWLFESKAPLLNNGSLLLWHLRAGQETTTTELLLTSLVRCEVNISIEAASLGRESWFWVGAGIGTWVNSGGGDLAGGGGGHY